MSRNKATETPSHTNIILRIVNHPYFNLLCSFATLFGTYYSLSHNSQIVAIILAFGFVASILIFSIKMLNIRKIRIQSEADYVYKLQILKEKLDDSSNERINALLQSFSDYQSYLKTSVPKIAIGNIFDQEGLSEYLTWACQYIKDVFDIYLDSETSICIKLINTDGDGLFVDNQDKWKAITIARSARPHKHRRRTRRDNESVLISENSDFSLILNGEYHFASANLDITIADWHKAGREYKNSTQDFLSLYKSTIVVPICIEQKWVSLKLKTPSSLRTDYHVLGFLCLDSLDTFDHIPNEFERAIEYMESFSDSLYHILESFLLSQLSTDEENTVEYAVSPSLTVSLSTSSTDSQKPHVQNSKK